MRLRKAHIVAMLTVSTSVLGYSARQISPLLVLAVVIGCGGASLSLVLSSWLAVRAHDIKRIDANGSNEYSLLSG